MLHQEVLISKSGTNPLHDHTKITQFNSRYLVSVGCIKPLCDLLTVQDIRMVTVTLEGLENILKVDKFDPETRCKPFSSEIEESYGM